MLIPTTRLLETLEFYLMFFRVNNLINAAYLGKNMYFSSVTRIQSPKGRGGDENNISIMKRRLDTRINDGYQQAPRLRG